MGPLTRGLPLAVILVLGIGGCASLGNNGPLWPKIQSASVNAVKKKSVWIPLLSAAVIGVTDADDSTSDWATEHTALFGSAGAAADGSSDLVSTLMVSAVISSLLAESDSRGRFKRVAINGLAVSSNHRITRGMKNLAKRERPNGLSDQSFPSMHASNAFVAAEITSRNLAFMQLDDRKRSYFDAGLYTLASTAAWARVEAGAHYPSDVLAGAALGSFLAGLFNETFLNGDSSKVLSFQPLSHGATVTLYWQLYP